ncbi:pyridoxamine 5'-phosphate oxidase family protein [Pseudomonas sp.]|uniref:pyridoxamine 5'-phosphate oxidase family protein n=1 Tax=Pseudomonas sp. TaxID=306 RepID=UPI003862106A
MTQGLADMRRDYTRDGLTEAQAPAEPFALFHQWFADAVKTEQAPVEANALTLATVDQDGRPHCRILLLKGLTSRVSPSSPTTTAPRASIWPRIRSRP